MAALVMARFSALIDRTKNGEAAGAGRKASPPPRAVGVAVRVDDLTFCRLGEHHAHAAGVSLAHVEQPLANDMVEFQDPWRVHHSAVRAWDRFQVVEDLSEQHLTSLNVTEQLFVP